MFLEAEKVFVRASTLYSQCTCAVVVLLRLVIRSCMSFAVCACLTAPYDTVHATWRNNPASPESHNRHAYIPGNMPRKFVRITCPVSKVYSDTVRTATGLAKVPGLLFSASSSIRSNCRLPRMLDFDLLYLGEYCIPGHGTLHGTSQGLDLVIPEVM